MKRKAFSCAVLSMATALLIPGISLASPANTIGQWFNRSGKWYYGKDEDSLRKEWIVSDGDWYYLRKDSGELQSGWLSLNGKKYFLNICTMDNSENYLPDGNGLTVTAISLKRKILRLWES